MVQPVQFLEQALNRTLEQASQTGCMFNVEQGACPMHVQCWACTLFNTCSILDRIHVLYFCTGCLFILL